MPTHSIHLATLCYGGVAQARYLRSLLALCSACARREVPLHLDLGGGEAQASRGRAGIMARFLAGTATHLLFADSEAAFTPQDVFAVLDADLRAFCRRLEETAAGA